MAVWGGPQFWITTVDNNIYFQPSQIWSITPIQFREFECGCNDLSHISTVEHHICRTGMFQSFGTPKFPTAKQKKNTNINPWWRETRTWKKQHVCYWISTRMGIKWLTQCFSSTKYLIQTSKEARHGEQAGKGKTRILGGFWSKEPTQITMVYKPAWRLDSWWV